MKEKKKTHRIYASMNNENALTVSHRMWTTTTYSTICIAVGHTLVVAKFSKIAAIE